MKILLIEDDVRQVQFAQQTLSGHELFVCGCKHEAQKYFKASYCGCELLQPFDLMVTDLFLPARSDPGYKPSYIIGLDLFEAGLRLFAQDMIKGVALISNFEHHVNDSEVDDDCRSRVGTVQKLTQIFGKRVFCDEDNQLRVMKSSPKSWNALTLFDVHVDNYTHVLSPQGELMPKAKVYKQFGSMKAAKTEGFSLAKLFKFVVNGLLQD